MKKSWVLVGLVVAVLAGFGMKLWADGSFVSAPGPVVAATGQNYYYPAAQSSSPGALLVQDASLTYRYSNAVVTTTSSLTVFQIPALPLMTKAQIVALTPATTGQIAMCTDCSVYSVCVSTGVGLGAWSVVGSSAPGNTRVVCQ